MVRAVGVAILIALALALPGCARHQPAPTRSQTPQVRRIETAQQIASRLKLHLTGETKSLDETIPATLDGLPWALYQSASIQGGYDLRPYRGTKVTFRSYGIRELSNGSRQSLWVVESGSKIVGAYIAVHDMAPGISGVGNPS